MNVSKQEPEVPSKETSEKEVRENYILCSNLHRLVFASNQNLHRKIFLLKNSGSTLRQPSFGLANPKGCTIFFDTSKVPNLMERDRNFLVQSWKDYKGEKV